MVFAQESIKLFFEHHGEKTLAEGAEKKGTLVSIMMDNPFSTLRHLLTISSGCIRYSQGHSELCVPTPSTRVTARPEVCTQAHDLQLRQVMLQ